MKKVITVMLLVIVFLSLGRVSNASNLSEAQCQRLKHFFGYEKELIENWNRFKGKKGAFHFLGRMQTYYPGMINFFTQKYGDLQMDRKGLMNLLMTLG